jgi:hypothetical protein
MKLTPRSIVIFDMLTGPQQVKKFHALYETRRFITLLTAANYCFCPDPDESNPQPSICLLDPTSHPLPHSRKR